MMDPLTIAVAFLGNLKAKIINIHQRYSGYLISLKYEVQNSGPVSYQQSFFQNNSKIIF